MLSLLLKRNKEGKKGDEKGSNKLPKNINTSNYTVCFKPHMGDLSFEGSVAIDLKLLDNAKQITINALDLLMTKVVWEETITQNRQEPLQMKPLDKGQFALIFDPFLVPQKGQLRINFNGNINEKKLVGLCRSRGYANDNDFCLATFFEPAEARRCFPCFDEPTLKASFDVSVIIPKGQAVIGNTVIKARYNHKKNPKLEIVEFKRTPRMATYSVAFVTGNFECIQGRSTDNEVALGVYAAPNKKEQGSFALNISSKAIPFLSKYFQCPFPLQKLDLIAIPDLPTTTKDCWGLVMFQETHLLREPEEISAADDKQYVALTVCQEIVKQWVGNMVTFDWWNHIWIKESLAMFLRYVCMEEVRADYESSTHFVTTIIQRAMRSDALKSTHPLDTQVNSPQDSDELCEEIFFKKGASLMRMLYNFCGEEYFKNGLILYLKKFKFRNASHQDLWKCFDETSNKPVTQLMNNWTSQKGYPLLKVSGRHEGKNRYLKVSQEKFSLDPSGRDARAEGTWIIPFTVTSEGNPTSVIFQTLIDAKANTIVIPDCGKMEWLKINPGVIGFYRVKYSPEMFTALVHAIRDKNMEPIDRQNILDDQFALFLGGIGTTIDVLTLTEAYLEEDDYNVWCTIGYVFDKLLKVLAYIDLTEAVEHFGRYLFGRILEKVGFKPQSKDTHQTKVLRNLVLRMMVKFKHYEVIKKCKSMFDIHHPGDVNGSVDLLYVAYNAHLSSGEDEVVRVLMKIYKESHSIEDRDRIINSFGSITEIPMVKHLLDFSMSEDVRKTDTVYIMLALSKNKSGRDATWNFLKEGISIFKNRYGTQMLSKLIKGVVENFASEDKITEITEFMKQNPMPGSEKALQLAIENIRVNESWLKREKNPAALQDYLEADAV